MTERFCVRCKYFVEKDYFLCGRGACSHEQVKPSPDPVYGEMATIGAFEARAKGGKCGPDGKLWEPKPPPPPPPPPLCKDCRWWRGNVLLDSITDHCVREGPPNLVRGGHYVPHRFCDVERELEETGCGPSGKYFEPKPTHPPEPVKVLPQRSPWWAFWR